MFGEGGGQNSGARTSRGGRNFSARTSRGGEILVQAIFGNEPTSPHP